MIRIIAIVVAVFGLTATAAQAEICNHHGHYNFSGDGEHPMSLRAKVGTTCEATFGSVPGPWIFTFKRLLLVSAPARGRIKLREGGYYIYTAPPTAGSDSFALKVCGTQNGLPGCATLKFSVTVN